jgi:NTP pyrophosphatase (non-canonical NTP hydrolase)
MIVVGGRNSANARCLAEVCSSTGTETHHIEKASETEPAWLKGKTSVGVTTGTSIPDQVTDESDAEKLREELGDLLLHIVLQAQIANESGEFTIDDVIKGINAKLIHRHPHVFGKQKIKDVGEILHNWQELKMRKKQSNPKKR